MNVSPASLKTLAIRNRLLEISPTKIIEERIQDIVLGSGTPFWTCLFQILPGKKGENQEMISPVAQFPPLENLFKFAQTF